jgi:cell wall-associated NlpC family hydrolase
LFNFIGIPFQNKGDDYDGCDCFGLVRLFYKDKLNELVPNPSYQNARDSKQIHSEYLEQISSNWREVDELQKYDVVAMAHDARHPHIIQHCGVYLGNGEMLHTLGKIGSHIVGINEYKHFIKGYFRWRKF